MATGAPDQVTKVTSGPARRLPRFSMARGLAVGLAVMVGVAGCGPTSDPTAPPGPVPTSVIGGPTMSTTTLAGPETEPVSADTKPGSQAAAAPPVPSTPAKGIGGLLTDDLTLSVDQATTTLAAMPVITQAPSATYSRAAFGTGWGKAEANGLPIEGATGCDMREAILARDGQNVTVNPVGCQPLDGQWNDPYTGRVIDEPSGLDIDHIVPLKHAWLNGAADWSDPQRRAFANDPLNLVAVSASANRSKGDQGPDTWRPDLQDSWCGYGLRWIAIKTAHMLGLAGQAERDALGEMLQTCPAGAQAPTGGNPTPPTPDSLPSTPSAAPSTTPPTAPTASATPTTDAPSPDQVYYETCAEARAAGAAPLRRGQPGYRPGLDRDDDGIACQ